MRAVLFRCLFDALFEYYLSLIYQLYTFHYFCFLLLNIFHIFIVKLRGRHVYFIYNAYVHFQELTFLTKQEILL